MKSTLHYLLCGDFLHRANCFSKCVTKCFQNGKVHLVDSSSIRRVGDIPFKIDGYDVKQGVDARCIHGRKEKTHCRLCCAAISMKENFVILFDGVILCIQTGELLLAVRLRVWENSSDTISSLFIFEFVFKTKKCVTHQFFCPDNRKCAHFFFSR